MDQEKYYESYQKLEQDRQAAYGEVKKYRLIGLGLIFVGIIFAGFAFGFQETFLGIGLLITTVLVVIAVIMFVLASKAKNNFLNNFKSEAVNLIASEYFNNTYYNANARIRQDVIDATGMVKRPDRSSGSDYISGTYRNVDFEVSEVIMQERKETRDSKGNRQVRYETYFSGRWYIYRFPKTFNGTIKIVEGGRFAYPYNHYGLVPVETESIAFNKKFKSFSSDEQYFFYQITPMMMDRLMKFERAHGGRVVFFFSGNEIHLGVSDYYDYFSYNIRNEINDENMKQFRNDIIIIPAIINEFRLQTSKFQQED